MSELKNRHHIITALVENKAGVLARIAGLFARRGFNIYSLAVAPTHDPDISRFTIVVDVESAPLHQIVSQLDKLINVVEIKELDPTEALERELLLTTVNADSRSRSEIIQIVSALGGSIVDAGISHITVELAGTPDTIDTLEELLRSFGIVATQRTGRVALPKLRTENSFETGSRNFKVFN